MTKPLNGRVYDVYCMYVCVEPRLLDTYLEIVCAQWCHDGSVLAIGGQLRADNKDSSFIYFHTPLGMVCSMKF